MIKKKYKNEIFQLLLTHPLGIDNFNIEESNRETSVTYLPHDGLFKFDFIHTANSLDDFFCRAILYNPKLEYKYFEGSSSMPFSRGFDYLKIWLSKDVSDYKQDKSEPDLWEEYLKNTSNKNLKQLNYEDHTNFTQTEKNQILLGINELKLLMLENYASNETEREIITARLNYLTEATQRTENKTDWKGIFINTFITICIALSLDTQRGNELYQLFLNVLNLVPLLPNV